ncbi:MAG TPA: carbohydrate kinase family protein [Patescibacteria group bacterium]|nr:carbohydrate kinase family protein [Patescibacteria group bacterium]
MAKPLIVISGSLAIDRIMNFDGHYRELIEPSKIEVLSVSVLVNSLEEAEGGTGANIAHNLASMGEKPILLASAGKSATSYVERLATSGIDTSNVHISKLPTASFNVLTDSASNQVGGFYPGAMADASTLSFEPYSGQDVIACISAHDPVAMRRQSEECVKHKIRLVYDPGQQVSNISGEDLRVGVEAAEVVIVNEYELDMLTKKTGWTASQLESKIPVLISTHGEQGSRIAGKSIPSSIQISSAKPVKIADPTGAGDAYRAGFLYGYLRQWEPGKCGQLGSVVASFALEQHGPQAKLSQPDIEARYQQTFNEKVVL